MWSVVNYLKYADSHEWVKVSGKSATIGITDHAQDHLGDIVYVELLEVGSNVTQGSALVLLRVLKPLVILADLSPERFLMSTKSSLDHLVNGSPYENGWIIKVEISDANEVNSLIDSEQYSKFCEEEDKH